ncbi:hypothetical protein OSB04_023760 [Centaurea solstitialis]|uniref:Reverse transcriptase domain-containing protein n=1 Tax=Centaurea solstitialis TaxID=347529 RepID=A0AA38SSD4_9ASTR|nr:hypothetical protein OSB04_023760 [Centaurea solstitialis]
MEEASLKGYFNGLSLPNNGPSISHLLFVDDVMFVGYWSLSNAVNFTRILRCFHLASGLKVNYSKSKVIGVGVHDDEVTIASALLKCEKAKLPFTYLGITVGGNMGLVRNWKPVIDKKPSNLSFGGRATLCKAVLGSIPLYFLSLFKAPNKVIDSLDQIRKKFMWGVSDIGKPKIHWVSWQNMVAPKKLGGLGIGLLKSANLALLSKWWWKMRLDDKALWAIVIKKSTGSRVRPPLRWLTLERRASVLDSNKSSTIASRYTLSNNLCASWDWSWLDDVDHESISIQIVLLKETVQNFSPSENFDSWKWEGDPSGVFLVKSLRSIIDNISNSPFAGQVFWNKWLPPRVNCFIWRVCLVRIPTKSNLRSRGIPIPSDVCSLYDNGAESVEHLFYSCPVTLSIWRWLIDWCNIQLASHNSLEQLLFNLVDSASSKKAKFFMEAALGCVLWCIWKARNDRVFNDPTLRVVKKSMVYPLFFGASGQLTRIGYFELIYQLENPNRASAPYPNRAYTFPKSGKLRFPESGNRFPEPGLARSLFPNRAICVASARPNSLFPKLSSKPSYPLEGDLFLENMMSREIVSMGSESRPPVLVMGEYAQWKLRMIHFLDQLDRNLMKSIREGPVRPTVTIAEVPETDTCPLLPSYTVEKPYHLFNQEQRERHEIDKRAMSLLIMALPNDMYSRVDSFDNARDIWIEIEQQMQGETQLPSSKRNLP